MDATLDNTTLSTLSLLEARLLRIEHLLYGPAGAPSVSPSSHEESVAETLEALERRFYALLGRIKVYGELMKICMFVYSQTSTSGDRQRPQLTQKQPFW